MGYVVHGGGRGAVSMSFYEIEFPLRGLDAEAVEAVLLEIGAGSISFVDRGDEPVLEPKPGEIRLWSDTLVRALFHESSDAAQTIGRLAAGLGSQITETARTDQDAAIERGCRLVVIFHRAF